MEARTLESTSEDLDDAEEVLDPEAGFVDDSQLGRADLGHPDRDGQASLPESKRVGRRWTVTHSDRREPLACQWVERVVDDNLSATGIVTEGSTHPLILRPFATG